MTNERREQIRKNAAEIVDELTPKGFDPGSEDGDMSVVGVCEETKDKENLREGELFAQGFRMMLEARRKWLMEHGPDAHAVFTLRRYEGDRLTVEVTEMNEES